jgi:molecular chaperone GrpE
MTRKERNNAKTAATKSKQEQDAVSTAETEAVTSASETDESSQEEKQAQAATAAEQTGAKAETESPPEEPAPEEELSEEEKLKKQVAELEDKLLRTAAEFDNYKKRTARQLEEMIRSANDKILLELLEVADNFERALRHSNERAAQADVQALQKGMELIFNQLKALLDRYHITPIEALGQPFDPNLHEALMQVDSDEYPEGVVALEICKGYKQGDRVLRHSKVGVSKGKPAPEKQEENESKQE